MSRWPVVFGITGIITAAFSILGGGCNMLMPAGMMASITSTAASADLPSSPQPWSSLLNMGDLVLAVLLLVASIGMLRRREWSVRAAVLWGWAKSVSAIGGTIVTAIVFRRSIPFLQSQLPPEVMGPETVRALIVGVVCISLVLGLSTPVFVLIWFRRARIRAEVAGWA